MRKILSVAALAIGMFTTSSHAATLTFTATPQALYAGTYGPFSVTFNDNDDNLLDPAEVTSFSGITIAGFFWDKLSHVGGVAGFTNQPLSKDWEFKSTSFPSFKLDVEADRFAYNIAPQGSDGSFFGSLYATAPEPLTWALMIAGFAALGLARRRRAGAVHPHLD